MVSTTVPPVQAPAHEEFAHVGSHHVGSHHVGTHHTALRVATVAATAIATVFSAVALWLWNAPFAVVSPSEAISEALAQAAASQEVLHNQHGGYPVDPRALVQSGWLPVNDVDVTLVSAAAISFCPAAGPAGEAPVAWFDQDWRQLDEPCD